MLGFGLTQYIPYVVYGLAFLVAFLALFYRSEIGILFIASLLPVYTVLNRAIKSGLPFATNLVDILVIAMLLGWLLQSSKKQEQSVRPSPLLIPIAVFMVYSLFSFLVGSSYLGEEILPDLSNQRLATWKNYMIMPVLYIISYYNLRDRKWKYALFILLFLSFLVMDYKFYNEFRWVKHYHYMEKSRLGGTLAFLGPNEWGTFHAIYTLFIIGLFLVDKHFWRRAAYFILILGSTYSLIYSFSRGSYIGFLGGLFFIGIVRSRKVLVVLVIFLIFWKSLVPMSVVERVEGTFVEEEKATEAFSIGGQNISSAGRQHLWVDALDYFSHNPFLGTGYDTYQRLTGWDTHNVYLRHMAEQGIIGLFIYLWLYVLAFKSGWRLYRKADEELVKALGFGFLCAVVGSIVVNFFGDRWTYLQLGGLYWIFWALVDQENSLLEMAKEKTIIKAGAEVAEAPTS